MMLRYSLQVFVALLFVAEGAHSQTGCGSYVFRVADTHLNLAPPSGFLEVCSRDHALCSYLRSGYPPSVATLGYFVTSEDWNAYQSESPKGFSTYLIAQLAKSGSPSQLPALKDHLRAQHGELEDHSEPPPFLTTEETVQLGIFDETQTSISFGIVTTVRSTLEKQSERVVSTNSVVLINNRVLSLYVYHPAERPADIDSAKQLTTRWLACLRAGNR